MQDRTGAARFITGIRIIDDVWATTGVGVVTCQIGRCQKKLQTFYVTTRRAIARIDIATSNPFGTRRNTQIIASAQAFLASHTSNGMAARAHGHHMAQNDYSRRYS